MLLAGQGFDYSFQIVPPQGLDVFGQKKPLEIDKLIGNGGCALVKKC